MLTFDSQMNPSHILAVYQWSDPSKRYIAKKVHEESNELEIFKRLNTSQEKSEHIISLHESFQTQSTSWVILPEMNSVSDYVWARPDLFEGKGRSLKSAWASSRASRIFTSSVSLTGTSSPITLLSTRTFP